MEEKEKGKFKMLLEKNVVVTLIIALLIGLLVGIVLMYFANGGVFVAKVKGKMLTNKELYNKMKGYYSINLVLEDVDKTILDKKYKLDEDELKEVKEEADYYIAQYEQYGYSKEEFLSENGFKDYDDFVDYLAIDYKRKIYYYENLEKKLEEDAIKKYYDENAFGKVNNKHILVRITEDSGKEKALETANQIIERLNAGESFNAVYDEYSKNGNQNIITEDLGKIGAFEHLEESYIKALKTLDKEKYTTTPIETSYGYHIIYCVDKEEKSEEISRKDKMTIIDILLQNNDITVEPTLREKTLIEMRTNAKLKFYDKELQEKYDKYCKQYAEENGSVIKD